ncbi:lachesin, partial [Cryptotermes secundus]|uniref:lachesin n=1 Tax=Cryptotermes secundus TaxID=105785 RepID=UPI001454D61C
VGWLKAEDQTVLSLHNKVVTQNSRISVTHDNHRTWQLHIRQVKESDRGCYMCQINTSIMKKQVVCVDVHVPPDILYDETSTDLSVQENENATLVCKATGHPPPRITWRREDGEPILLRRGPRDPIPVKAFNGSLLHFWRLDRKQMGAFLCIASNDVPPAVSRRIILNVNFAPVVKVPNQLLGAPLGTDVQLQCYVEAFPNTINYWIKNHGEMLLDGPKYSIRENRSAYKVSMCLVIRSFGSSDIGTYNCVSTNSLGRAEGTVRLYGESNSHEP